MDIRDFNKIPNKELPEELFNLDILDGSPPCTTFSMAGKREESWGKKKKFREGQAEQTLDDLSFIFIETVAKLKPKCVVMENVEGLLLGGAWAYVQRIYREFKENDYRVKHFLCKGEYMGVPQTRHRVFFIAVREDIGFDPERLNMSFNYEPITYERFKTIDEKTSDGKMANAIRQRLPGEKIEDAMLRIYGTRSGIMHRIAIPNAVYPTQTAGHADIWTEGGNNPSNMDVIHAQTFPEDYNFGKTQVEYVCGMSVPPLMIKRIVLRLIENGVFDYAKLR
jgi:DNA (cytosine-5)-methyltransferase 1